MLAIQALGNQFISDIQVGSEIVRDGIYAWLRHPSEIGLLLIAAGGPLLVGAPLTAITALLLLLPISLWRMRREDLALALAAGHRPRHRTGDYRRKWPTGN
jgi:protein-S-isoprenylcysteine O-methyltransferase Ste14